MQDRKQQFEKLMLNHLSGNISDTDECILLEILNSHPQYKTLYYEMVKTKAISQIPVVESEKASNYKRLIKRMNNGIAINNPQTYISYFAKIAAIIVFVLSTSISIYYVSTEYNSKNNVLSYETIVPHGSQSKIILPDGTVAWLNSGSTLKYNNSYGNKNRTVFLTGEGYFEVRKNAEKPFIVCADNLKIKVLGTIFNVRSYMNEASVEVNLLEGKVDVSLLKENNSPTISLLPNQKIIYNKASNKMQSYKSDAARAATWTTGKICFVDASLEDISKDLERRYDVKIQIKTQSFKSELFSGSLNLNQSIDKILDYIDVDKKYNRTFNGNTITITNRN